LPAVNPGFLHFWMSVINQGEGDRGALVMTKSNRKRCFLAGYGILWRILYPEFGKEHTSTYPIKKQHLLHVLSVKIGI
jgi:hypothetical protein